MQCEKPHLKYINDSRDRNCCQIVFDILFNSVAGVHTKFAEVYITLTFMSQEGYFRQCEAEGGVGLSKKRTRAEQVNFPNVSDVVIVCDL